MIRYFIVRGVFLGVCLLGGIYWAWVRPGSFVLVASDGVQVVKHAARRPNSVGFFVINLDHSVDRWKSIQKHLTSFSFPVVRVSGIYGKQAPTLRDDPKIVDLERYRMYMKGKEPGLGEIGCYLSHRKALIAFLASDYEYGVIVEDDVSFAPDITQIIQDLLKRKQLWDVCTFELHPLQSGWPLVVDRLCAQRNVCILLKEVWRAGAYIVNPKAAEKFVEKSLPICLPWDMYYMRSWEFQLCFNDHYQTKDSMKFVGIEPRCAFQTFGDSEIEAAGPRQVERPSARDRYLWSGRYFSWCSHITRFLYGIAQWVQLRVQENFVQSKKVSGVQNNGTPYYIKEDLQKEGSS